MYACNEVERLLEKVYTDYRYFDKGRLYKTNKIYPLRIKKDESITGPKSLFEPENKDMMQNLLIQKNKSSTQPTQP